MKILGIKIAAQRLPEKYVGKNKRWKGYWRCKTGRFYIKIYTGIMRKSEYDAVQDAIRDAQKFSKENNIAFITEGYRV